MTYIRTETVSGTTSETQVVSVVTDGTADSVSVSDGATTRSYVIAAGRYLPASELSIVDVTIPSYTTTEYTSQTPYCPPPAVGETYTYTSFVPGPFPGTGEYVTTTETVVQVANETVSTPAGEFSARKVVLQRGASPDDTTITRYYAPGIGVVKDVEDTPADATTVTLALVAYDTNGPALGTADNPIVITAGSSYASDSIVSYVGHVGTGALYFKLQGLLPNNVHTVELSRMSDNADLYVYADAAFTASICSSVNAATADETCSAMTTAEGELYIQIDGSLSAGTDFALRVWI